MTPSDINFKRYVNSNISFKDISNKTPADQVKCDYVRLSLNTLTPKTKTQKLLYAFLTSDKVEVHSSCFYCDEGLVFRNVNDHNRIWIVKPRAVLFFSPNNEGLVPCRVAQQVIENILKNYQWEF